MGHTVPEEIKKCPKCSQTMSQQPVHFGIPGLLDDRFDRKTDQGQKISLNQVFAVEAYLCPTCRYLELYAD